MPSKTYYSAFYPGGSGSKGSTSPLIPDIDVSGIQHQIDVDAETAILWGFKEQQLTDYVNGKLYVEGKPVNTVIVDETEERIEGQMALAKKFELIGVVNETGKAIRLNYESLLVDEDKALGLVLDELTASTKEHSASISTINKVVVTPNGAAAKALFQLDVDGKIVGYEATNDGSQGRIVFKFDSVEFQSPTGAPLFTASNGKVIMGNVEVDTLKANSVTTTTIVGGAVTGTQTFSSPDIQINSSGEITVLETPYFFPGDGIYGRASAIITLTHDASGIADNALTMKTYLDTGSGWVLQRTTKQGIATANGNTAWIIDTARSIPIESVTGTRIRVTATGAPLGNAGVRLGAWMRNINVDVFRGQR